MKPTLLFESDLGFRIVQVELPPGKREPKAAGEQEDDGVREIIEIADGRDALGMPRWKHLEKSSEGVATYNRICHALKRELLLRLEKANAENL